MTGYPILTALMKELRALQSERESIASTQTRTRDGERQVRIDMPGESFWLNGEAHRMWCALGGTMATDEFLSVEDLGGDPRAVLPAEALAFLECHEGRWRMGLGRA